MHATKVLHHLQLPITITNSPDTRIQQPKEVEQKQPFLFGKSSKSKMEEHGPSFSASEDSNQYASDQADTHGKVRILCNKYQINVKCIFT